VQTRYRPLRPGGKAGGIYRTVIKQELRLLTILVTVPLTVLDAMYNEPLTFDVLPGKTPETRVLHLHGPITLSNLFEFQKVLVAGTEKVTIIDFTESPYMDSAGLGLLLNYYVSGKRHGRHLRLVGVNYRVAALLELTQANSLIKSFDTLAAAEAVSE
jgi:anti-anti-sigma factor